MSNIVELGDGTGAVRAACREAMQAAGLAGDRPRQRDAKPLAAR